MPEYIPSNPKAREHEYNVHDFCALMDDICTYLTEGAIVHERSALYMYDYGLRGFGRLHEYNAKCDFNEKLCLEKLLVDRLDHIPMYDATSVAKALSYTIANGQLKESLKWYINREKEFEKLLVHAVAMAAKYDTAVYKKLLHILSDVQEEIFRVKEIYKRLEAGQWAAHDLMTVSAEIHKHFESKSDMDMTLS